MITATSTTPQELHLRQFHSFLHCLYQNLSLHERERQRGPRTATVESQRSSAQQRCAWQSLCSNWNNHHSVDELRKNQRLRETVLHVHRDVHNRNVSHRRGGQYLYPALAWRCTPVGGPLGVRGAHPPPVGPRRPRELPPNLPICTREEPDKQRHDRRHFHQLFRQLRLLERGTLQDRVLKNLGHFDDLLDVRQRLVEDLQHFHH